MSLILAGIDEAGYGPTLGPLTVGLSVFHLHHHDSDSVPNLWALLSTGVCKEPGRGGKSDARGRVAIADSKRLKLANSVRTTHPLVHLERGVLAMLRQVREREGVSPASDAELFSALGAGLPGHECYAGAAIPIPVSITPGEAGIAANLAAGAFREAGVGLLDLRCEVVAEPEFNTVVRESGTKGETTIRALSRHLARVWEMGKHHPESRLGIVCDRLGGRAAYAVLIENALAGTSVETVEESPTRSRYLVRDATGRRAGVSFLTECESAHLPVALASMAAKLVREMCMARFNRYWSARFSDFAARELKPTAGYAQDARRWLDEIAHVMPEADRAQLVRIA